MKKEYDADCYAVEVSPERLVMERPKRVRQDPFQSDFITMTFAVSGMTISTHVGLSELHRPAGELLHRSITDTISRAERSIEIAHEKIERCTTISAALDRMRS